MSFLQPEQAFRQVCAFTPVYILFLRTEQLYIVIIIYNSSIYAAFQPILVVLITQKTGTKHYI